MRASVVASAAIAGLIIMSATASCRRGKATMPKPEAYPRIEMPDSSFHPVKAGGLELTLNRGAETTVTERTDGGTWITISYPTGIDAKVYLTLTPAAGSETTDTIIANRRERMSLNLSGSEAIATTLTSRSGWECEMLTSNSALSTPVQILASDGHRVISGALYLDIPASTAADSVAPVIDAIDRDMLTLLKNL